MDRINHILWLKCRLTMRGHQASASTTVGTVILLVITFCSLIPAALLLAAFLTAFEPWRAGELVHVTLAMAYVVWIGFPVMGFKINEFFDVTRLLPFPVPTWELFTAGMLSSFLDISSFILYPFLAAVLFGNTESLATLPFAALVMLAFTMHTFAMGQLVLFLLVHLLNLRRVSELLLVVFPLVLFLSVCGLEVGYLLQWPGGDGLAEVPPSTVIGFLPPGVAANALAALRAGDLAAALYHGVTMLALTALTMIVAGRLTEAMLRQAGPLETLAAVIERLLPARRRARAGVRPPSRLTRALTRLFGAQLSALASKELRLMVREPQVRMALGFYVATTGLLVFAGFSGKTGDEAAVVMPLMAFSAVFILGSVLLNSLALEREGLKFVLSAPLSPAKLLIGNNLAHWALVSAVSVGCLALVGWSFRVSWALCAAHLYLAQAMLLLLLGFGNLSSVLVPYRLPAKGVHHKQMTSGGQHFLVVFLGSLATTFSVTLAAASFLILWLPPVRADFAVAALNVPFSLAAVVSVYAACTALAAWILQHRREPLLREVVD